MIFFVEDSIYAAAIDVDEVTVETQLSGRESGLGVPSWRVDGIDFLAPHLANQEALVLYRKGTRPVLIEA
jgi:2-oxoisovalerate dehydrogenase E1 component